ITYIVFIGFRVMPTDAAVNTPRPEMIRVNFVYFCARTITQLNTGIPVLPAQGDVSGCFIEPLFRATYLQTLTDFNTRAVKSRNNSTRITLCCTYRRGVVLPSINQNKLELVFKRNAVKKPAVTW
ncbi:hypothetical protein CWN74_28540, partial [Klebsiella pneumoniae]